MPAKDDGLISDAFSTLNKFSDDGSFMHEALRQKTSDCSGPAGDNSESEVITSEANRHRETSTGANDGLSANQLAAKAFQLRMKGKHEEAEKLLVIHLYFSMDSYMLLLRLRKREVQVHYL